ncbi:MAG: PASTA domain-containing protein, partial [Coriobacteriia bacterium]|nr:PASTA domain-containing protein [Coriobacteriia bacterium]
TSQRNRDVWFAGYTPVLSTAVWVGYTQEQTIVIRGSRAFGGTVSAPIWREFMLVALQNYEHRRFATAANPPYDNSRFNIPVAEEPDLAGLTLDEARALLDGFDIVVEEVYSDTIPAGRIVSASFSESRVTLRVSKGPDPSNTPSQTATPTP